MHVVCTPAATDVNTRPNQPNQACVMYVPISVEGPEQETTNESLQEGMLQSIAGQGFSRACIGCAEFNDTGNTSLHMLANSRLPA